VSPNRIDFYLVLSDPSHIRPTPKAAAGAMKLVFVLVTGGSVPPSPIHIGVQSLELATCRHPYQLSSFVSVTYGICSNTIYDGLLISGKIMNTDVSCDALAHILQLPNPAAILLKAKENQCWSNVP
jgi:hypothetical protein